MIIEPDYGGIGHSVATQTHVIEAISYADPSTAACVNMHWAVADLIGEYAEQHPGQAGLLRDCAENQAMFAGGAAIPADELDPSAIAARFRRVEGGWRGGGRMGYATNAEGASYVGTIGSVVDDQGRPIGRSILVLNPPVDTPGITVRKDWDAMGLRASATHTVVIEDAFVGPEHAFEIDLDQIKASTRDPSAPARITVRRARSQICKGGMWLGHCQHIQDLTVEFLDQRRGTGAVVVQGTELARRADAPWAQSTLGEMRHWIETGRLVLYSTVDAISDGAMDPASRAEKLLIAMYHLRLMCEEVAKCLFRLVGAHGFVASRPFERMYRDLIGFVATSYKAPDLIENIGRATLGMPFVVNAAGG
jgi:alkylation response protein AidB-like acyl-CoA dehydrogenase